MEEVEEEANEEVNKILMEVVPDMPDAPWKAVVSPSASEEVDLLPDMPIVGGVAAEEEEDAAAMAALQARAEAL